MTESTENQIEVSTADLMQLFAESAPFAHAVNDIPAINVVALEFGGDDLVAVATDRYTLGVSRLPVGRRVVQPARALPISEVARIRASFKPAKGTNPTLLLTFGVEALSIETTHTLDGLPTVRVLFPWATGKPVPWRSLVKVDAAEQTTTGPVVASMNPELLAKFVACRRGSDEPITIWPTTPTKPWRITVGDHFTGVIMPVRMPDSGVNEWTPADLNEAQDAKARARSRKAAA